MKKSFYVSAIFLMALGPVRLRAQSLYWDIDGPTSGAGGATPSGTWDASALWTSDAAGGAAAVPWNAANRAVFSAGTNATGAYTVTVSGTQTATGLDVEDGNVTLATGTLSLGAGTVTVGPGAALTLDASARISTTAGSTVTLNGGTLRSSNTGNAGTFFDIDSQIILGAGGGSFFYGGTMLNIVQTGTVISGAGNLTKTGSGVLAFASTGNYTGATIVTDGELRVRTSNDRLPTTTAVTVSTPGILNLNGLNQRIGSLSGNGLVGLGGTTATTGVLTVGDATSTTFSGSLRDIANAGAGGVATGNGKLTKVGTGALTLSGASTYTGATTISAGSLVVTGSLTGTAKVDISGTLAGNGVITTAAAGNISLLSGGIISPGTSVGTLTMTLGTGGSLSLTAGVTVGTASLMYELAAPGASDKIVVTGGPLDIGNGVLEFDDFSFTALGGLLPNSDYVLFDGDTPIVGTLGAATSGPVGTFGGQLQFADGGRDLILHTIPEPSAVAILLSALTMLSLRRRR
jgi:autotransporter-associated beta strand protein